jgi:rSAM/selenodomain-associated transferase 2/rSAM/selenodomain-associated transferase 1
MAEWGKHKVPTLRNVDKRPYPEFVKAYGHNGFFKSLEEIVHFYNTRDVEMWPEPEVPDTVNDEELGDLGLSEAEEAAIVTFMKTLSDQCPGSRAALLRYADTMTRRPHPSACVTLMTRMPHPGQTKTRMIPALGAKGASELHAEMASHVALQLRMLRAVTGAAVRVAITGGTPAEARRWLGLPAIAQAPGDLGARQADALATGLTRSEVSAVIGADCPGLDAADIAGALQAARARGTALVPALDGGYCLLAARRDVMPAVCEALAGGITWGGADVATHLLARLRARGTEVALLEPRPDVDLPEDLAHWERIRSAWYEPSSTLAVVVPTLDEAENLPSLLARMRAEQVTVIVADGGSSDATVRIARDAGVMVVECARGRAAQMNAGAGASSADALLFLHADTLPEPGFARSALNALADPSVLLGAFRFSFGAGAGGTLRLLQTGTRLRGSLMRLPYGDQGLYCRRVVWRALGGFPDFPVMEDYEFVRRARRAGTVRVIPHDAVTSDRRWREHGPWRWTALNMLTAARYELGATPEGLARWRAAQKR